MCGIVCVVSRPSKRAVPSSDALLALLDAAIDASGDPARAGRALVDADTLLKGEAGVSALAEAYELQSAILDRLDDRALARWAAGWPEEPAGA